MLEFLMMMIGHIPVRLSSNIDKIIYEREEQGQSSWTTNQKIYPLLQRWDNSQKICPLLQRHSGEKRG
jgi:hypothetical protein